jgi:hypothetical protein
MRFSAIVVALAAAVSLSACAKPIVKDGKTIPPYGLVNEATKKVPGQKYEISAGSVIVAIVLSESIVFPVYIAGWDLYQPIATP